MVMNPSRILSLAMLALLIVAAGCENRRYPVDNDNNSDEFDDPDSVYFSLVPAPPIVGLDSLAFELEAYALKDGLPQDNLLVCFRLNRVSGANGYFFDTCVESGSNPPGKVTALFVSDGSPSGAIWLVAGDRFDLTADSVMVDLHKRPELFISPAADTMFVDDISISFEVLLLDDQSRVLPGQDLFFDTIPPEASVTATRETGVGGNCTIYFDPEDLTGLITIFGWMAEFPSVRDTVTVLVVE
ncbi:MAG: hypothetical protein V2A34_04240 [Lentisphaerota bacterium]